MSYGCEFQSGPSSCRRWSTSSLISPRLRVEGVCRRVDDRHCKPSTYWPAIRSEFVTLVVTSELLLKQWIALLLWLASLRPRPGSGRLKTSWLRPPAGFRAGARTGSGIPRTHSFRPMAIFGEQKKNTKTRVELWAGRTGCGLATACCWFRQL